MFQVFLKLLLVCLLLVFPLSEAVLTASADEGEAKNQTPEKVGGRIIFAKVGSTVITMQSYQFAFIRAVKDKFYHGKPPQSEVAALQREVGQDLVNSVFLVKEAKKRGIEPNAAIIEEKIKKLDKLNADNKQWKRDREKLLQTFKTLFEEQNMVEILKKRVIDSIPELTDAKIRKYYEENPEKFTEPEKIHIWVILLKVDPSSSMMIWEDTKHKAMKLVSRLKKGEDFEALAKEFSDDESAKKGGDMGFVHKGVLAGVTQTAVDKLGPEEFSPEPIELLEGFAILKRGGRVLPKLREFQKVKNRASRLLMRVLKKTTWEDLKVKLSEGVPVEINDEIYLPLEANKGKTKAKTGKE